MKCGEHSLIRRRKSTRQERLKPGGLIIDPVSLGVDDDFTAIILNE